MRAFVRTGDRLLRITAKLFRLGVLSRRQTCRLICIAERFTRTGLVLSPRRWRTHFHSGYGKHVDGA